MWVPLMVLEKLLLKVVKVDTNESAQNHWSACPAMTVLPLNSVVAQASLRPGGTLYVKGYAMPGDSGNVEIVDISLDEGKTWQPTRIIYQEGLWSWTLWEVEIGCLGDSGVVYSRATDVAGNVQPQEGTWNFRGVAYNGWGVRSWRAAEVDHTRLV